MGESNRENTHQALFNLAEAVPAGHHQTDGSHGSAQSLDRRRPSRWLRRSSNPLSGLHSLRCRDDWKDTLVRSSTSARQQLGSIVKLGPQVGPTTMLFDVTIVKSSTEIMLRGWAHAKGDGTCDHNPVERAINIITSLPYFALGLNTYR